MSSNKERIFVVGATGSIGIGIIRGLIKKEIQTTAYVRNEQKAKSLFEDELKTGYLTLIVGTYETIDVFSEAIQKHTRLFLLVTAIDKPTLQSKIKGTFGKIAFEEGVRQIVNLSSLFVTENGKKGIIAYAQMIAEEKLWTLAEENPEERSLVVLRPGTFMSNHLMGDVHHIKHSNKFVSCGSPSTPLVWIDTDDISDCAVVILTEPVEKHDRIVYEMGAEVLTNEERAAIFSKVLERPIVYEQQSLEDFFKIQSKFGLPHAFIYDRATYSMGGMRKTTTPQLAYVLGRPLGTLETWIKKNAQAFT
ncbi:unnamed protein product [Adineta ricciae]|uniref:NmrA-like domain-containing protein n=1 Tax=Adineta ricciae TaxID=249248 RepID=A0A815K3Q5_ADIRI|nr:unnamed protein product [Adineta ricciae]CAF1390616.1 unnamed protein product [Adineta ricciae]